MERMEHNTGNPIEGLLYVSTAIFSYIMLQVSMDQVSKAIGFILTAGASLMAIRYYYYATKKVK